LLELILTPLALVCIEYFQIFFILLFGPVLLEVAVLGFSLVGIFEVDADGVDAGPNILQVVIAKFPFRLSQPFLVVCDFTLV
jgi:hypothetical protein